MSIVTRTAKKSPRLFAIALLIALVSTIVTAAKWDSVSSFVMNFGLDAQAGQLGLKDGESKPVSDTSPQVLIPQDTRTVCNTGTPDFATVAAAVADANAAVPAGGRTYLVCAGLTETAPAGGYVITATGASAVNPVVFVKDGVGANPTITAPTTHTVGSLTDAIFKIVGADNITIDGFTMLENGANTVTTAASNNMTEFGVALFYATTTNGAQNISLQNNTITLNRTYQNTFGIYSNSTHSSTSITTAASATTTAGGNSGLKVYSNNINNVNMGIVVVGPTAAADYNTGIDIGGVAAGTGNNITNFGTTATFSGYLNVSGTVNGILVRNSVGLNISYNTVTSSVGGVTSGTLNGIQIPAATVTPTGTFTNTINNNNISLQSAVTAGAIVGITQPSGSATTTSTFNCNNNNFQTFGHTVAGASGTITFITSASTHFSNTINNNTFTNLSVNTTGSVTFISNSVTVPAGGSQTINGNSIVTGFNKTGAGGTVTGITTGGSSTTVTSNWNNNNFSNMTVTGATAITFINNTDGGSVNHNITGNTFSNITGGTSAIIGINSSFGGGNGGSGNLVSNNTISNINSAGAITGIQIGSSGTSSTVTGNIVNTLASSGAFAVIGITSAAPTSNSISKNKVYDLSGTNASSTVSGIVVTAGTLHTVFNNLIGNLTTPVANAVNPLIGLSITGGTTVSAYYNTVYLNASSTGALFGSSAVSVSTTPTVELRDNVFVNISTTTGAGLAVAYRRSTTTLTTYANASNNNDFFGSTIFTDGTNTDSTIGAYKTRVASRDSNSFSENPPFLSTTGSNPNFLHINPATATQLESGGTAVSGITDDFDGNTRNATTPDVGADEFTGTPLDLTAPSISYTALAGTASTTNRNLTATITDASGVAGGSFAPRIYFKKSTDAGYVSTQCTGSSPTYTCTIDYTLVGGGSVTTGDVIQYFVVAQDTAGNVGANPSGGFAATDVNTVTSPPTTPNSYTILPSISGNKTVGAGGDYATLTAAINDLNSKEITGAVTLSLTDASYSAGETFPLVINANNGSSATNTVTIKPATGVSPTISGSSASCVINFNGADYMTIDGSNAVGGTTRDLTIANTNTGTSSAVVCMTSLGAGLGATNDTVKNTNLVGTTTTTTNGTLAGVFAGSSTISISSNGADNDNNTVQNNNITKTSYGIYSGGESAANKNTGTVITQNVMNAGSPNNLNTGGIFVRFENAPQITLNDISVLRHDGTSGQTATAFGIALGLVPSNTVTTFTGSDVTNATVTRNKINGLTQLNSTGYSALGIVVNSVTSGTTLVANNMISGIRAASTASDFSAGIVAGGGTGSTTQVYHNSVSMTGTRGAATFPSYGLAINSGDPIVDVRNNIFYNTQTSSSTGKMYAIGTGGTTFANLTSDYNDFYVTGASGFVGQTGGLGTAGTDRATLTDWQTATGKDGNSKSVDPLFVDPAADLHLQGTSTLIDMGIVLGAVTNDFDGETRPQGTSSEIGADEIAPAPAGTVQFSSATYSVTEGTPTVTLTVTRTGGSNGAVTVNYTLGGGTATGTAACGTPGEDYVNTGGSVIFANGDAADKTFDVPICNDAVYELAQTFNATLSIGSGGATLGTPNPATVTINNDDSAPTIGINDVSQSEGNAGTSNFGFGIAVTGASEVSAGFSVQTADGTATAPSDYTALSTTAISAPADVNRTTTTYPGLVVAVNGDTMFEANETFFMNASGCSDCTISDNQGVGTIQNDDVQPTVQFSSATYTNTDDIAKNAGKGDDLAPQVATITVTRAGASGDAFSVNYATSNGTATGGGACGTGSGVDYVSTSGTLNFAAGDMSKTFNVTVCTDNLFEGDETVNLTLSNPTAPVILGTPNPAVLTITDNDTQPSLQFSSATYSNSDDIAKYGVTTDEITPSVATITVTRTGAVDNVVAVNYATSNGTATGGASCTTGIDYISTSGTLNFAAGVISQTFNVTVCTDALFEGDETVNLTLSNPTGGAALGTPNSAVLTIVDNDAQPSLQFSSATYSVGEGGGSATITVTRTGAPDNAVSVNYATVAGGTATGGASCGGSVDYQNTSGTLNFAAGVTSQTFSVAICDDATAETSETVNLALTTPGGGAVLGAQNTAVLSITDNDAAPTLQFSSATYSAAENVAGGVVTLTVTRSGATGNAVSVDYGTGGGTATAGACAPGVDYNTATGTLNFASGVTSQTFNVTICNDSVYELNQTFNATLTNPTGGATLGTPNPATVTINNDDAAPTVTINDITQAEGNSGTTNFQTTFTVSGASEVAGGFSFATADNTATSPSDYTAIAPTAAVIPANVNRTTATLNGSIVLVNGDTTVEADETFFLNGSSCTDCSFTDNQGLATIQNDDSSVQFATSTASFSEGAGAITITVTRTGSSTGAVTANYGFLPGTASGAASCGAGVDFASASGTLNWASGDITPKTIPITICEDALVESNEDFVVGFTSVTGATTGSPTGTTVTIIDNDSDTTAPTITYTPLTNVGTVQDRIFTVTATDNVGVTGVTVVWRNNDGGVGNFLTNPCSFAGGTAQNGTWTCTIVSGVGTQTNPGTVDYFVSANDAAANSATNPVGATVNGGTWNMYTIGSGGTINVGTINTFQNIAVGNGFTFGGNATVTGNLTLSGGVLNTGANTLTLGCNATITGGGEPNYVVGRLEKLFCGTGTFTFHMGAPFAPPPPVAPDGTQLAPEGITSNYSPLTVNILGGTVGSSLTVSVTDAFMAGAVQVNSISRYWDLTENGNLTADLAFTYRNEDVVGNEATYNVLRRESGMTANYPGGTVNAATNTFSAFGVSNFSQWSAGTAIPTAANASISGRVLTASGQGIRNATVVVTGGSLITPRYATTGTFGYYQFDDLPVGENYVVTVVSKKYTFPTPSIVVNLQDSIADVNFEAENR